jgi:hypothetical protein
LRGTNNYGLLYRVGNSKEKLKAFRNANFADDMRTRRPMSGSAVAWSSQLQQSVALSTEAEFIAASQGGQRAPLAKMTAWRTQWKNVVKDQRNMVTMKAQ